MHMADALISPAVGGTMLAATAAVTVYSAKRVRETADQAKIPLMGVMGAFVFAAQMLNFTIPGTGSSGHLGGGLLLAILLGPEAAFVVIASVLTVQALFFADGGLLALGCNIFNLGLFPAFVAYPLVYRLIVRDRQTPPRIAVGSIAAALVGLSLGALAVVAETTASGVSALPFRAFVALMLPIHLAIGLVEGVVTAAVVTFVGRSQPEILERSSAGRPLGGVGLQRVVVALGVAALLMGGVFAWFASSNPDGLEWSIARVTGGAGLSEPATGVAGWTAQLQEKLAVWSGYGRASAAGEGGAGRAGTSAAGVAGAGLTLVLVGGAAVLLKRRASRQDASRDRDSRAP